VTPLLHDLHCLRILKRITFWLAVLAYRCQNGFAPQYLADDLHQVAEVKLQRRLCSLALIVPAMGCSTIGDRAFCLSLPLGRGTAFRSFASSESVLVFLKRLKTVLFTPSFSTFCFVTLFYSAVLRVFYYVFYFTVVLCTVVLQSSDLTPH